MSKLGDEIRRMRTAKGWSQEQLAREASKQAKDGSTLSLVTVSRLENGHGKPMRPTVWKIGKALGADIDALLALLSEERAA